MDWMYGDKKTVLVGLVIWMFIIISLIVLMITSIFFWLGYNGLKFWNMYIGNVGMGWLFLMLYFFLTYTNEREGI